MTNKQPAKAVTVAMTGASGAPYALRLVECLLNAGCQVALLLSQAAEVVIRQETHLELPDGDEDLAGQQQFLQDYWQCDDKLLTLYGRKDWFSPVASGSSAPRSMVIVPASGGTLSAVASGASNNLIERAADVALKERRQLILVPRETPVSSIHLENMLRLSQMGAVVLPASPGFYYRPQSVEEMVDFVVARILDQLEVEQNILARWGEPSELPDSTS